MNRTEALQRLAALKQRIDEDAARWRQRTPIDPGKWEEAFDGFLRRADALMEKFPKKLRRCERPWMPLWRRKRKLNPEDELFRSILRICSRLSWQLPSFRFELDQLVQLGERIPLQLAEIISEVVDLAANDAKRTYLYTALLKAASERWTDSVVADLNNAKSRMSTVLLEKFRPTMTKQQIVDYLRVLCAFRDCDFISRMQMNDLSAVLQKFTRFGYHYVRWMVKYWCRSLTAGNASTMPWKRPSADLTHMEKFLLELKIDIPPKTGKAALVPMLNRLSPYWSSIDTFIEMFYKAGMGDTQVELVEAIVERAVILDPPRAPLYVCLCARIYETIAHQVETDHGLYAISAQLGVHDHFRRELIEAWGRLLHKLDKPKGRNLVPFVHFVALLQKHLLLPETRNFVRLISLYEDFMAQRSDVPGLRFALRWIDRLWQKAREHTSVENNYKDLHENFASPVAYFECMGDPYSEWKSDTASRISFQERLGDWRRRESPTAAIERQLQDLQAQVNRLEAQTKCTHTLEQKIDDLSEKCRIHLMEQKVDDLSKKMHLLEKKVDQYRYNMLKLNDTLKSVDQRGQETRGYVSIHHKKTNESVDEIRRIMAEMQKESAEKGSVRTGDESLNKEEDPQSEDEEDVEELCKEDSSEELSDYSSECGFVLPPAPSGKDSVIDKENNPEEPEAAPTEDEQESDSIVNLDDVPDYEQFARKSESENYESVKAKIQEAQEEKPPERISKGDMKRFQEEVNALFSSTPMDDIFEDIGKMFVPKEKKASRRESRVNYRAALSKMNEEDLNGDEDYGYSGESSKNKAEEQDDAAQRPSDEEEPSDGEDTVASEKHSEADLSHGDDKNEKVPERKVEEKAEVENAGEHKIQPVDESDNVHKEIQGLEFETSSTDSSKPHSETIEFDENGNTRSVGKEIDEAADSKTHLEVVDAGGKKNSKEKTQKIADNKTHSKSVESNENVSVSSASTCDRPYHFKSVEERSSMTCFETFTRKIRFFVNISTPNRLFGKEIAAEFTKCYDVDDFVLIERFAQEILFAALYDGERSRLYVNMLLDVRRYLLGGSGLIKALLRAIRGGSEGKGAFVAERMEQLDVDGGILLDLKQEYDNLKAQMVVNSLCLLGELQKHRIISRSEDLINFLNFYDNIEGHGRLFAYRFCHSLENVFDEDRWEPEHGYCDEE
ncbi:hypothetical protein QR680_007716 [Steinernema hermaphroditum]|uniref:MIF4G domain-containing protein n=1 Tax=Steinernema hermaphroditum TaxID=289476 RepID=A0AA39IE18_9BILA|nr:hypothetical protein QR680_007716 [Steinernema hermaphroditum]